MNRKKFFQETLKFLSAGAFLMFDGNRGVLPAGGPKIQENPMSKKAEFLHSWLSNMMKNMDKNLDKETKIQLLEDCGRACARRQAQKEALKFQGQLDGWLKKMKQWVGEKNVRKDGDVIRVSYSKCFCPLVQDIPPLLSGAYCNCSRGWLKEVFETVVDKPVKVKLEDSIMKGGKQCRFSVYV